MDDRKLLNSQAVYFSDLEVGEKKVVYLGVIDGRPRFAYLAHNNLEDCPVVFSIDHVRVYGDRISFPTGKTTPVPVVASQKDFLVDLIKTRIAISEGIPVRNLEEDLAS